MSGSAAAQPLFNQAADIASQAGGINTTTPLAMMQGQYTNPALAGQNLAQGQAALGQAGQQNVMGAASPYLTQAGNLNAVGAANPYITQGAGQNIAGAASPYINQALGQNIMGAASPYLNQAGQSSVSNISSYMNPYTQNVTDQIASLGARNLSENLLPAVSDQFIRAGQFGSSGMGTFGGRALRDTQEAILNQQSQALQTGYGQALGASQADLARQGQLASTAGQLTGQQAQNYLTAGQTQGQLAGQQAQNLLSSGQALGQLTTAQQQGLSNLGQTAGQLTGTQAQNLANLGQTYTQAGQAQQATGINAAQAVAQQQASDAARRMAAAQELGTIGQQTGALTQAGQQNLGTIGAQTASTAQAEAARQQAAQQQVADLAKMQQGLTTADAAALESVGASQQQQQQRGLDVAYQDFQNQVQFPQTQINNMSTTLRGLPPSAIPTTGTTSGYSTTFAPSPLSGIAAAYGTYKGLTSAKGGLIQGYAAGGAVRGYADGGDVQSLSDLEKSVMADYGQYHYKTVDMPKQIVSPVRSNLTGLAGMISNKNAAKNAALLQSKQLETLSTHLPAGVTLVNGKLQVDDTYKQYGQTDPAKIYNAILADANQKNNLELYNAKLAKEGKPAVDKLPRGLNPIANLNPYKLPGYNSLNQPAAPTNIGMGGIGIGLNRRNAALAPIAEGTRSMDAALQQYLNKGGNTMSLDALKAQIALGKVPQPVAPTNPYTEPTAPAVPDVSIPERASTPVYNQPAPPGEIDMQVVVYGPDGKAYASPSEARRAGVKDYTSSPPVSAPAPVNTTPSPVYAPPPAPPVSAPPAPPPVYTPPPPVYAPPPVYTQPAPYTPPVMAPPTNPYAPDNSYFTPSLSDLMSKYYSENDLMSKYFAAPADMSKNYAKPVGMSHGGRVPGYANDGYVDTENPADLVDGGQAFADQYAQGQQEYPAQQDTPIQVQAPSLSSYTQDPEVLAANAERKALLKQLQTSLATTPATTDYGPSESEKWLNFAAAFADPGKTGSFGEGMGRAASSLAAHKADQRKARALNAAADLQRLQSRSALAQQQYEMTMDEGKRRMIEKYLTPNATSTDSATVGGYNTGIPDNMKALLLSQEPADAVKTLVEMAKEQNKPSDLIRGVKFLVGNGSISASAGDTIIRRNLTPKVELIEVPVPELGGTVKMDQDQYTAYKENGTLPGVPKVGATATTATPVKQTQPITQEDIKATAELKGERNKQAVASEAQFANQQQFMKTINMAGDTVLGILKNNPKAVGYLSNKSLGSAIGTLVTNGIDTPWGGSLSMDVAPVLMKIDPKISQADLNALSLIGQPLTQIELGITKLTMKGDGTISNMERALPKGISGSSADPAQVLANKINFLKIAATKQDEFYNKMNDWTAEHPGKTLFDFVRTPEAKSIERKYDNTYRGFAKSIGIDIPTPATTRPSGGMLEQLKQEKLRRQNKG
jgi:hypothetical protein